LIYKKYLQMGWSQIESAAVNFKGGITAYTLEEKVDQSTAKIWIKYFGNF